MQRKDTIIATVGLLLIGMAIFIWLGPSGQRQVADITLTTLKGEKISMQSLRGRPVLVTFWATTCHACLEEMPHLVQLYDELSPHGLEIIGIAMYYDPPNRVLALRKTRDIPYTIAFDMHADAAEAFGNVRVTPTSFLIAPNGRVVHQRHGGLNMNMIRREIISMLKDTKTGGSGPAGGTS